MKQLKMSKGVLTVVALALVMPFGAFALTGSGDSGTIPLETVSPTLNSVLTVTERSLSATFSEPMLEPGIITPGNYELSGVGVGTLNPNPDGAGDSGPYTLTWTEGEMQDGVTVTVTATGLQDLVGNPIDPAGNSASCPGLGIAPEFYNLIAQPAHAQAGDTVTLKFTVSELLDEDNATVTVNGNGATFESVTENLLAEFIFTYQYVVLPADPLGMAEIEVSGYDLAGNQGSRSDHNALQIFDETSLPLRAWPIGTVLLAAGLLILAWRRRRASLLLLLLLAALVTQASLPALAQAPTVSNVTYTQGPNGSNTQVDITYDLDAPNGTCDITVLLSKDGLDEFIYPVTAITGDTTGVTPGTGKHIVWDIRAEYPGEDIPLARLRVTADDGLVQHALTYTAGQNGTIDGPTPQTVNDGEDGAEVTAVPDSGYAFSQWNDLSTQNPRTDLNVTADITVEASFIPDAAPPVVTSFAINSGAVTTTNPVVTLNNTATNSPTDYMASESAAFSGASWTAYGAGPSFTLTVGAGGVKTVYFKVRNASLVESAPVSDTISLTERTILLTGSVPLVLVWVPSGSFLMGRYAGEADSFPNEAPQHGVTLSYGFWMGKYEVTQQQWIAVRSTWPGTAPTAGYGLGNSYPAYYISWDDTKNFITTLNAYIISSGQGPLTVRLPSEAEWEYACRAGTATRFYFGDSLGCDGLCTDCAAGVMPGNRSAYMWYCGNNSPAGSKAVGGKASNAFGLYDMSGNVWEWCEDDYHSFYTGVPGAPTNGTAWINSPIRALERVVRGGYWSNYARLCRSAYRLHNAPGLRHDGIGFRLAAVQ